MPIYYVEVRAKLADGCEAKLEFELDDPPEPETTGLVLADAFAETNLLEFLCQPHARAGNEKITLVAQVKVR